LTRINIELHIYTMIHGKLDLCVGLMPWLIVRRMDQCTAYVQPRLSLPS
jgi:hypothetical protein